jgi:TrmH family RNA methyltransferase
LPSSKARLIRSLARQKKVRDLERAFILEGLKPIDELSRDDPGAIRALVVTEAGLRAVHRNQMRQWERRQVPVYTCSESLFDGLADTRSPAGILAVVRQPEWDEAAIFNRPRLLGFYGECLQDPANVGAIIRTAAAFGWDGLWLSKDSADVFNPKVVRAAAGQILKLPVFAPNDLSRFRERRCTLLAAEPHEQRSRPLDNIDPIPTRCIVALGNESRGLSPATLAQADLRFHIPIRQGVESLNVAATAAIVAFYCAEQRGRMTGGKG